MNDVVWKDWPEAMKGMEDRTGPGLVEVKAKLVRAKKRFGVVHANANVAGGDAVLCEAELVFSFIDG